MWNEALTEFNRVAGREMRPFGTVEFGQLGKIFVVNSGPGRVFDHSFPNSGTRRGPVFEFLQFAAMREAHEDDLAAAGAKFLNGCGDIIKTLFGRLIAARTGRT